MTSEFVAESMRKRREFGKHCIEVVLRALAEILRVDEVGVGDDPRWPLPIRQSATSRSALIAQPPDSAPGDAVLMS